MSWLDQVIGYGTYAARPAAGSAGRLYYESDTQTLVRDSGSAWVTLSTIGSVYAVLLNWEATSDLSALSVPAHTWTDTYTDQNFTVTSPTATVEISARGVMQLGGTVGSHNAAARIVVDTAGSPITAKFAACRIPSEEYGNVLAGTAPVLLSGLSLGSHTVKVQVYSEAGDALYSDPISAPDLYAFGITVVQHG